MTNKRKPHVFWELTVLGPEPDTFEYLALLTRWDDDRAIYTIQLRDDSMSKACERARKAGIQVDTELRKEQLLLPDQGDWTVQYFSTTST